MANKEVNIFFKVDGLDGYIKDLDDLKDALDNVDKSTEQASDSVDDLDRKASKSGKGFSKMGNLAKKAFSGIKAGIAATGIGLFLTAIAGLVDMFSKTDAGAKVFAATSATIGVAFDKISSLVGSLREPIEKIFSDPKQAIIDFGEAVKTNIINRFEGILNFIPSIASAVSELFKGNFKEAGKIAFDAVAQVTTGVTDASDKIAETIETVTEVVNDIIDETGKAIKASTTLVDAQNNLRRTQQQLLVDNAKLNQELETQQRIADDTTRSYDERKAALDRVNQANEQLADNAVRLAEEEKAVLEQALALAKTDEERRDLKDQLAQAEANLIDAETQAELVRLESAQLNRELDEEEKARLEELEQIKKDNAEKEAERNAKAREKELAEVKRQNDALIAAEDSLQAAKFSSAQKGIGALSALAGENEKIQNALFLVDKALAVGKVIVDSVKAKAANVAYAASLGPAGPAYLLAANQAVNINTAASLATLAATTIAKFKNGGAPSVESGASTASAQNALNYNVSTTGDAGGTIGLGETSTGQNQPILAYVLANDVTNAQQANQQIQNLSRL